MYVVKKRLTERKIYNVRHAWTLKKLVRLVKEFTRATTMEANGVNVFRILTFGLRREQRNITFDQSGIVRNFRKGSTYTLHVLGKPKKRSVV